MGKYEKLIEKILSGNSDANIAFDDLCELLRKFHFVERIRGSHHIFRKNDIEEKINLQQEGALAKPYQVCQIRNIILKYRLAGSK